MSKRKKYSPEFKREAVLLTQHLGVSKAQVARELGVNVNSLGSWCREYEAAGGQAFPGKGNPRDVEVARLRRELARIKKERDFLAEAAAFFAKESS